MTAVATRPFTVSEYVRWGDTDPAGIIHFGAYLRFFELAEGELFRSLGLSVSEVERRYAWTLPRRVLHIDYLAPVRIDDRLTVRTYFSRIGRTSLTLNFDCMGDDGLTLHAAGHLVLVCVSRDTFAPEPLPPEVLARLEPYRMSPEEARAAGG